VVGGIETGEPNTFFKQQAKGEQEEKNATRDRETFHRRHKGWKAKESVLQGSTEKQKRREREIGGRGKIWTHKGLEGNIEGRGIENQRGKRGRSAGEGDKGGRLKRT